MRLVLIAVLGFCAHAAATAAVPRKFAFGGVPRGPGWELIETPVVYSAERGFGFEPEHKPRVTREGATSSNGFYFSVDLPEGNWRVTLTLGGSREGSTTTVKAELRRWMAGPVAVPAGSATAATFVVNVRTAEIAARNGVASGRVELKAPRETEEEAWAWDQRLTLEFSGERPNVRAIEITPASVPTIFLLGDSTVSDQPREPFASWGQMLPRFFGASAAVANHAHSGETYRDSLQRRRLDKVISQLRKGDWVLLQFGHNDQKQIAAGTGDVESYRRELRQHVELVRQAGGMPVVISSMERRRFDAQGKPFETLTEYAEAARAEAAATGAAFIDLHAVSFKLYGALGPERSADAFAAPGGKVDNTHHNPYGAFLLAQAVATAALEQKLGLATWLTREFERLDPMRPIPISDWKLPPSPLVAGKKPAGD